MYANKYIQLILCHGDQNGKDTVTDQSVLSFTSIKGRKQPKRKAREMWERNSVALQTVMLPLFVWPSFVMCVQHMGASTAS